MLNIYTINIAIREGMHYLVYIQIFIVVVVTTRHLELLISVRSHWDFVGSSVLISSTKAIREAVPKSTYIINGQTSYQLYEYRKILVHRPGKVVDIQEYMKETKPKYLVSLVVPAYNEEKRLPPMLKKTLDVRLFGISADSD